MLSNSDLLAKSDREPVHYLSHRHKTDPKAKSTEAAKARNEVQPSHLWWPFKFCNTTFVDGFESQCRSVTHQIPLSLQRRCSQWQCLCHTRYSTRRPDQTKRLARLCFNQLYLGQRRYELPLTHGCIWIFQSEWTQRLVDVAGVLALVSLQDARLPHCQGFRVQVAERTQV